jgi:hypothetical protein
VPTYAGRAIGQIGPAGSEAIPELLAALRDGRDNDPWNWAAEGLAGLDASAVSQLVAALRDSSSDVRTGAALALGGMGPHARSAAPAIATAATSEPGQAGGILMDGAERDVLAPAFVEPAALRSIPVLHKRAPSLEFEAAATAMRRAVIGRWMAQDQSNIPFYTDLYPSGRYRIWRNYHSTPGNFETLETGSWDVAVGYNGDDNRNARGFLLCFHPLGGTGHVTGGRCGVIEFEEKIDYSAALTWTLLRTDDPALILERGPERWRRGDAYPPDRNR